jgi:hypothetical protein
VTGASTFAHHERGRVGCSFFLTEVCRLGFLGRDREIISNTGHNGSVLRRVFFLLSRTLFQIDKEETTMYAKIPAWISWLGECQHLF